MALTQSATAIVITINEREVWRGASTTIHRANRLFPTVRFETQDGKIVETELTDELPRGVEVGQELAVLYDPLRPEKAALESAEVTRRETRTIWFWFCAAPLLLFFGVIILLFLMPVFFYVLR